MKRFLKHARKIKGARDLSGRTGFTRGQTKKPNYRRQTRQAGQQSRSVELYKISSVNIWFAR
jgi:hypothetical protein